MPVLNEWNLWNWDMEPYRLWKFVRALLWYKKTVKSWWYGSPFLRSIWHFSMFHQLILYNVFNHFAFCTKNCDINGICFDCSRVYFTKDKFVAQCALFSKIRYSRGFISHNLSQILLKFICFSNQKYFWAIQSRFYSSMCLI